MKLSSFEKIIRKVVREEIDYALRREIALLREELTPQPQQRVVESQANPQELENFRSKLKSQVAPDFNTGNNTLNTLLSETALAPTPEQTFAANDPVNQFVNKDYSEIMTAIDSKKNYRP